MNLTETERAYLAGLFDGEGCVGLYKERQGKCDVMVTITNTDAAIMQWLVNKTGIGTVCSKAKPRPGWNQGWIWQIRNRIDAKIFLDAIRPYLLIKADQADLLLTLLDAEQKAQCGRFRKVPDAIAAMRASTIAGLKRMKPTNNIRIQ